MYHEVVADLYLLVINPAMRNAIVGIKPTVGLTSRGGVVPESSHQDSVGPFGKTVRDATYVLDVRDFH